jgi:hypothetical protein
MNEPKSGAMAPRKPAELAATQGSFNPGTVADAWKLAKMLSQSGLVPTALRNKPEDVLVVLMTGREMAIPPMTALRTLHVIEGRVQMSAEMMVARCKARPDVCLYFTLVETDEQKATYETQRAGAPTPTRYTYSTKDATAANLISKPTWKMNLRAMLRARASSGLARIEYPDLVAGIIIEDESDDVRLSAAKIGQNRSADLESAIEGRIATAKAAVPIQMGPGMEIEPEVGSTPPDQGTVDVPGPSSDDLPGTCEGYRFPTTNGSIPEVMTHPNLGQVVVGVDRNHPSIMERVAPSGPIGDVKVDRVEPAGPMATGTTMKSNAIGTTDGGVFDLRKDA